MKNWIGIIVFGLMLASCGGESEEVVNENGIEVPSPEELSSSIDQLRDSLVKLGDNSAVHGTQIPKLTQLSYVEKCLLFYRTYPEHEKAPDCLKEVHFMYGVMGAYPLSAQYGDTLLEKYPKYKDRLAILESQISNYDFFIKPWDGKKVEELYNQVFKEFPNLPADKKADFQYRLDNMDLTGDELIDKQIEEAIQ